jgi:acetyltransferase-like isoleucine patch superfamily enzyme
MSRFRRVVTGFVCLCLPSMLARCLLRLLGHTVGKRVRLGFSIVLADHLALEGDARIGHFNIIVVRRLVMRAGSYFGRANVVHGPMDVCLRQRAAIGNNNKVVRGPHGSVTSGPSMLRLGELTKITSQHRLDCTSSIHLGDFTQVAGTSCQLWTHGYVHAEAGADRYRIDGSIRIGSSVYVGSGCIVTAGVCIADGVMVGAGSVVSKSLVETGLYVGSGLRQLARPADPELRLDLVRVIDERLCERVYRKHLD